MKSEKIVFKKQPLSSHSYLKIQRTPCPVLKVYPDFLCK